MDAPYGYPHVLDALSFQEFYFPKTAIMDAPQFPRDPLKIAGRYACYFSVTRIIDAPSFQEFP